MNKYLLLSVLLLLVHIALFESLPIDLWLQDHFFDFLRQTWQVDKENPLWRLLFYSGIKKLFIGFVLIVLIALVFFQKNPTVQAYRQGLLIVLLSVIILPLGVSLLKAVSNVPCPKDIQRYGGDYPHNTLCHRHPVEIQGLKRIKCYPAGHASGGFALLSLWFLFKTRKNRWRALWAVLLLSWTIGGYKILIGDHFLSHTVVSMWLAAILVLLVAKAVYSRF
jgi:membrane-associated PAP2 superfamily phosphatase